MLVRNLAVSGPAFTLCQRQLVLSIPEPSGGPMDCQVVSYLSILPVWDLLSQDY